MGVARSCQVPPPVLLDHQMLVWPALGATDHSTVPQVKRVRIFKLRRRASGQGLYPCVELLPRSKGFHVVWCKAFVLHCMRFIKKIRIHV